MILEEKEPGAGTSGVAGGLFSPMIALRGRPVWRIDEAIEAFHEQLAAAGATALFDDRGVFRPARDDQQVEYFRQSVERCPDHAKWLPPDECRETFTDIVAPFGGMLATTGGAISLLGYTHALVDAAQQKGARLVTRKRAISWGAEDGLAFVDAAYTDDPTQHERLYARRVVIAGGRLFFSHRDLKHLHLHAVKGQTARLAIPSSLAGKPLIPLSGKGYVIPEKDAYAIGSSFEHQFDHDRIERAVSLHLRDQVAAMLPDLAQAEILDEQVGIRVTVPGIRLPMVGPIDSDKKIWTFTAFGSKGLLLAPLLARELVGYMEDSAHIPQEVAVRMKSS